MASYWPCDIENSGLYTYALIGLCEGHEHPTYIHMALLYILSPSIIVKSVSILNTAANIIQADVIIYYKVTM